MSTLIERLEANHRLTETGCWEWTRSCFSSGYGQVKVKGRNWRVHKLAWELFRGPVPDGQQLHHECYNRRCFNPEHLDVRTPRDNVLDADSQSITARNAVATHCIKGHPLSGANLYIHPKGQRVCRECQRQAWHRWNNKRKKAQ